MMRPTIINIPKKRTLESLMEQYEYSVVTPATAEMALVERQHIIHECDLKGYHTEEDMMMIDYLWKVRNTVVNHIIHQQEEANHNRKMIDDPYYRLQFKE